MEISSSFERIFLKKIYGKNSHDWFELGAKERDPEKNLEKKMSEDSLKTGN